MSEPNATNLGCGAREFVYGLLDEGIVVLLRETAEANAHAWAAARESRTWREFRARVGPEEAAETDEQRELDGRTDDEPFDATRDVPGFLEGNWPEWPLFRMRFELPSEVRTLVGRPDTSLMSGDYYEIDHSEVQELVTALTALGYRCTRDDELIAKASGY